MSVMELAQAPKGESSADIRQRVVAARAIQTERYKDDKGVYCNAQMSRSMIERYAQLDTAAAEALQRAMRRLDLSCVESLRRHLQLCSRLPSDNPN